MHGAKGSLSRRRAFYKPGTEHSGRSEPTGGARNSKVTCGGMVPVEGYLSQSEASEKASCQRKVAVGVTGARMDKQAGKEQKHRSEDVLSVWKEQKLWVTPCCCESVKYKARNVEMMWKTWTEAGLEGPIGEFAMITVLAVQRITGQLDIGYSKKTAQFKTELQKIYQH